MIPQSIISACVKAWYGCNDSTDYGKIQAVLRVYEAMRPAAVEGAQGASGGGFRVFYSAVIKALAGIVNVPTPDKLFDLDAIPRDPIMEQVVRIRAALDDYSKNLAPPPATGSGGEASA